MSTLATPERATPTGRATSDRSEVACWCFPPSRAPVPGPLTTSRCASCVELVENSDWILGRCEMGHGTIRPPALGDPRHCDFHAGEAA